MLAVSGAATGTVLAGQVTGDLNVTISQSLLVGDVDTRTKDNSAADSYDAVTDDKTAFTSGIEQVSGEVDLVFIADCNGDGSDHLQLARPGLEKGVATFVDKPMARTLADARELVELAAAIALENFRSKFNPVFAVESGESCALPWVVKAAEEAAQRLH